MGLLAARDWTLTALGITVGGWGLRLAVLIVLSGAGAGRRLGGQFPGRDATAGDFQRAGMDGGGGAVAEALRAPAAGREVPR